MARSDQAGGAVAVVPNDNNDLGFVTFGVWVGGAGNMVVIMADGEQVTFSGISAGTLLPIQVKRIIATLTTATLIVALKQ